MIRSAGVAAAGLSAVRDEAPSKDRETTQPKPVPANNPVIVAEQLIVSMRLRRIDTVEAIIQPIEGDQRKAEKYGIEYADL